MIIIKSRYNYFLWFKLRGFCFRPFIFLPKRIINNDLEYIKIEHEKAHYERQGFIPIFWVLKYFGFGIFLKSKWSKKFRFQEEKIAYEREIKALNYRIDKFIYINYLVYDYWKMCTKEEAEEFIESILKQR